MYECLCEYVWAKGAFSVVFYLGKSKIGSMKRDPNERTNESTRLFLEVKKMKKKKKNNSNFLKNYPLSILGIRIRWQQLIFPFFFLVFFLFRFKHFCLLKLFTYKISGETEKTEGKSEWHSVAFIERFIIHLIKWTDFTERI